MNALELARFIADRKRREFERLVRAQKEQWMAGENKKFCVVWSAIFGASEPTTEERATKDAEVLARANPGVSYYVLQAKRVAWFAVQTTELP